MNLSLSRPFQCKVSNLVALSLISTLSAIGLNVTPVSALTWTLNPDTQVQTSPTFTPLTGSFTIDNESSANPSITASNISLGSLLFTADEVDNIDILAGVTAIDWLDEDYNLLSLVFDDPLTSLGGNIILNSTVSNFTDSNANESVIIGSVSSSNATSVPEPSTLLGLILSIALGGTLRQRKP